jgi:hypothetical protein
VLRLRGVSQFVQPAAAWRVHALSDGSQQGRFFDGEGRGGGGVVHGLGGGMGLARARSAHHCRRAAHRPGQLGQFKFWPPS